MSGRAHSQGIAEGDYAGVLQALSSTAKGRAFLAEHLRRHRPTETRNLLNALQRIEATVRILRDQVQPERIGSELRRIAGTLDIALEDARADHEGDRTRRDALIARASGDLMALADSLSAETDNSLLPQENSPPGPEEPETVDWIEDDLVFLDQLGGAAGEER